jgi:hypothetical protein
VLISLAHTEFEKCSSADEILEPADAKKRDGLEMGWKSPIPFLFGGNDSDPQDYRLEGKFRMQIGARSVAPSRPADNVQPTQLARIHSEIQTHRSVSCRLEKRSFFFRIRQYHNIYSGAARLDSGQTAFCPVAMLSAAAMTSFIL